MWGGIDLLLLLQWKYWILRIRSPLGMTCDFLFVIVIAAITLAHNSTSGGTWHEKTIYQPFCASTKPIPYLCPNNTNFIDSSRPVKHPTRIIYSPENPHLAKIMNIFMVFGYEVEPKKNRKALEAYFRMNASTTLAGIQFDDSYSKATDLRNMKNFKASIRFPAEIGQSSISNWATHELIEREYGAGPPQGSSSYYKEEFLSLQQILGLAFIFSRDGSIDLDLAHLNESNSKIAKWVESKRFPQMYMQRFPYGEWWDDKGPRTAESLYSLKFLCALLPFVANTVKWIVLEKERQLKEFIKIMGLSTWMYWLSWFLQCYIYLLVLMTIFLILMLAPIVKQPIFPYSNSSIVLSFFLVYSAALVAFILATSALFPKATRAVICSIVFRIAAFALFNLVSTKGMAVQLAACLWPDTAVCIGLEIIWKYEKQTEGCQRHNLFEPVTHERNTSLGLVILMLILDIFVYMFLAIYIEAIYPSEFGTHYPWNFLCRPSYWRPKRDTESNDIRDNKRVRSGFLEAEPKGLKAGVQIKGLTKVYGSTTAVDGLSLNLYENQITVLLGRNGAGKTTTISMLSGMITPTSGTAILNGYDIRRDMRFLRKCIGICPQHNILYDNLTVEEHLYFYSRIKALPKKEIKAEIKSYLVSMEFTNKRKKQAKSLSGGMKRKLCICIALCGNSKIVMLDEPTSGLDPNNRRKLWDLLLKHRTGKTILLTTHFMDEADVLGDRIAIMAGGELKCCGSSFFLKKLYGSGYILVIDKGPRCDVPKITALLKSSVPEVQMMTNTDTEVSYSLPENRVSSFEAMLKQLESQSSSMGIRSYGISLSSMEEVFIKASRSQNQDSSTSNASNLTAGNMKPTNASGIRLLRNQAIAFILKKAKSVQRSPILWGIHFLLPSIVIVSTILSEASSEAKSQLPALPLTLSNYSDPLTMVENRGETEGYFDSYKGVIQEKGYKVKIENIVSKSLEMTKEEPTKFNRRYVIGASFESINGTPVIGNWFNAFFKHSQPLSLIYAQTAVLRRIANCLDCNFEFTNEPFPFSIEHLQVEPSSGASVDTILAITLCFVAACFIMFPIRENASNARHMQFVAGAKELVFWLTTFLFDLLIFVLICVITTIAILCLQVDGCKTAADIGRMWVILLYYAWAFLPLVYVVALIFKVPATGYLVIFITFFVIGIFLLQLFEGGVSYHAHIALIILIPQYSLASGFSGTRRFYEHKKLCTQMIEMLISVGGDEEMFQSNDDCKDYKDSYYKLGGKGIGLNIIGSLASGLICFVLLFLIEYHIIVKVWYWLLSKLWRRRPDVENDEDSDVSDERRRISNMSINELKSSHEVAVKNLTKYYGKMRAVNGLCLGVQKNECFGLLGVNGAGKTSTFKMMTGDTRMTYGQGWVKGYSLNQMRKVHQYIGYCPQFDALMEDMTTRETLIMFALIKGYRYSDAKCLAETFSGNLDFREHLDKQVRNLSGGNKRKLSAAVALIGNPPILYFDEPTSGMDPESKYYFRALVRKIRDSGKCIILTSHSLEECEALCTRLTIMANGSFKCLGSVQHLKSKFAKGCTFNIKISRDASEASVNSIRKYIKDNLPMAQLSESYEEMLTYSITGTEVLWSKVFGILEGGKRNIRDIEDFSLAQANLEQVFLSFSK